MDALVSIYKLESIMEFKLRQPLQVMNKEAGEYQTQESVVVSFTGKKGLKTLKRLQDVIFKTLQSTAGKNTSVTKTEQKDVTVDDMLSMLEMTGSSEEVFDKVMGALMAFGTVGTNKLTEQLQNEMDIDDLDDLYQEVLRNFLLPRITQKVNNLSK